MSWHVLHLRPSSEKGVAEHCEINALRCYLPLRKEVKIYQRRKVAVWKPVFPGYFFVSFDTEGRIALLKTNHILRIFKPWSEEKLLHELDQIRKALAVDPTLFSCKALIAGRYVRIIGGPFIGIEGRVSSLKENTKVILNVEMIGQGVAVEVENEYLEILE